MWIHALCHPGLVYLNGLVWHLGLVYLNGLAWHLGLVYLNGLVWHLGLVYLNGLVWHLGLVYLNGLVWHLALVWCGGFFFACKDFGRMYDKSFPACAFFFFFKVEISSRKLIPLFGPGSVHSGSADWDHCDRVCPDVPRMSSFPDRFPHSAWTAAYSAHSDFDGSRVYAYLGVTCHLHFWQNDRGLLRAIAVTRGWSGQSWLWRRKFSRRSCLDSNSQPFDHKSSALTNELSRLPRLVYLNGTGWHLGLRYLNGNGIV